MSWRERVDMIESVAKNLAAAKFGPDVFGLLRLAQNEVPELIEGLRLCAEAVEAVEGGVGKVCADCGEIGECADWCSVRKALEWL